LSGDDRSLIGIARYEDRKLRERQSTGAQVPQMLIFNVVQQCLVEVLTTSGLMAGKA
jgi:hypothetical protein